jgi:hypothetical protein
MDKWMDNFRSPVASKQGLDTTLEGARDRGSDKPHVTRRTRRRTTRSDGCLRRRRPGRKISASSVSVCKPLAASGSSHTASCKVGVSLVMSVSVQAVCGLPGPIGRLPQVPIRPGSPVRALRPTGQRADVTCRATRTRHDCHPPAGRPTHRARPKGGHVTPTCSACHPLPSARSRPSDPCRLSAPSPTSACWLTIEVKASHP